MKDKNRKGYAAAIMISVEILLCVKNGEKYLAKQLESVFNQSFKDFHISAADDCSEDKSFAVLSAFCMKYPGKMSVIRFEKPCGSAKKAYARLIVSVSSDARYFAFCDQDDVWVKTKLSNQVTLMRCLERRFGVSKPLLVHSDLMICDKRLAELYPSFISFKGLNPNPSLNNLLCENSVTGCTCLFNRPLFNLLKDMPENAAMHDWWAALIASSMGRIWYIPRPLVLYRQHESNAVGAYSKATTLSSVNISRKISCKNAKAFYEKFSGSLPKRSLAVIRKYTKTDSLSGIALAYALFSGGYLKHSPIKSAGFIASALLCSFEKNNSFRKGN